MIGRPHLARWCALGAVFVALAACAAKPPEHGVLIDHPEAAPALRLTDAAGHAFDLAAQRGKPTFVYFGYIHCPDACPTTLTDWARARALIGSTGARLHFVFVSVDPERDTPQDVARYARQFDSTFTGLATTAAQLDSIKQAWNFAVEREDMPGMKAGDYGVMHPAGVYFVDGAGRMTFVFAPDSKPGEIASDVKRLL